MKSESELGYLLIFLVVAWIFQGIAVTDFVSQNMKGAALMASVMLLAVIGLICRDFLANIEWSVEDLKEQVVQKNWELYHGRQHLLREVQKQLAIMKKVRGKQTVYHDQLLKELAVLTHHLNNHHKSNPK